MKDMFRRNILGGSFAVMCMTLTQSATAEEVRVYNWDLYIDESLLEKFQEETGINLVYDVFESNETLETKPLPVARDMMSSRLQLPFWSVRFRQVFSNPWTCRNCPMQKTFGMQSGRAQQIFPA